MSAHNICSVGRRGRLWWSCDWLARWRCYCWLIFWKQKHTRNSSGDEIANVNFLTTTSYAYYKTQ